MKQTVIRRVVRDHLVAMVICCAVPLVAISVLSSIGVLGSWGLYALLLLCPFLHILMIERIIRSPDKRKDRDYL